MPLDALTSLPCLPLPAPPQSDPWQTNNKALHHIKTHRFLNQNPPMELTVPYKPNPLLFSSAPLTHNSQTLILLKLPKNPKSKNSQHRPNFCVLASANPNGSDGFSWLSLTQSCVVALLL